MTNTLGDKALDQVAQVVREWSRRIRNPIPHRPTLHQVQARIQVKMQQDLLAAVDSWTDPSTATAHVYQKYDGGNDMRWNGETITIVNRFENISVDAGTYCKAEWIDGEWQLYAADCPASFSQSSIDPVPYSSISPSVSSGGP